MKGFLKRLKNGGEILDFGLTNEFVLRYNECTVFGIKYLTYV